MIDGKILHGFNDGVGAVGWLAIEKPFNPTFKNKGCFEYLASSKGIINSVKNKLLQNERATFLKKKDFNQLSIKDIFDAHSKNDPLAINVLNETIEYWGIAAANIISLFNPEIIIFGGTLFGPALAFLENIKKEAEKWAQPIFIENVEFVGSKLGASAGLFGAGHLAMKKF